MGNSIHRDGDNRSCGATTIASQSTVFAGGKAIAVNGDVNSHGGGALIAATNNVFIGGIAVVNVGDSASADDLCLPLGGAHCAPAASSGLGSVQVGD